MQKEPTSTASILVLSLAVFIGGFLIGMLAVTVIPLPSDAINLELMFLAAGFLLGAAVSSIVVMALRRRERKSQGQIEDEKTAGPV